MKIFVNASNNHTGGGKVMLIDFLGSANNIKDVEFYIFTDPRFNHDSYIASNMYFEVTPVRKRFTVSRKIEQLAAQNDLIIYFGNIPPYCKHSCTVVLLLSNRYLIENYPISKFSLKTRIQLNFERWVFRRYAKNADYIVVQSLAMKDLLTKMGFSDDVAKIIPFKNADEVDVLELKRQHSSFLYVASGDVQKNHRTLISAWRLLAYEGIRPMLYLTIDDNTPLYAYITAQIQEWNLKITIKPKLPRDELLKYYYTVSALIYPSVFESYGLPLVEAMNFNLPIIASELDFVRDLVDPVETFDPSSPRSICRAVKRFLSVPEERYDVISGDKFIELIRKL